jgi:hypothetical protein
MQARRQPVLTIKRQALPTVGVWSTAREIEGRYEDMTVPTLDQAHAALREAEAERSFWEQHAVDPAAVPDQFVAVRDGELVTPAPSSRFDRPIAGEGNLAKRPSGSSPPIRGGCRCDAHLLRDVRPRVARWPVPWYGPTCMSPASPRPGRQQSSCSIRAQAARFCTGPGRGRRITLDQLQTLQPWDEGSVCVGGDVTISPACRVWLCLSRRLISSTRRNECRALDAPGGMPSLLGWDVRSTSASSPTGQSAR